MRPDIPPTQRGDIITARKLTDMSEGVNELTQKGVDPPKQAGDQADPNIPIDAQTSDAFIETSRAVSQVQVFDDEDENYALIDRIDSITFENGDGETLTLQFNNT